MIAVDQPATRESQAGPCGVAERPVVPQKPDAADNDPRLRHGGPPDEQLLDGGYGLPTVKAFAWRR
ncbi:MAG: hypothetical protein ACLQU2_07285 [Candidatus Binataceae bacterium]